MTSVRGRRIEPIEEAPDYTRQPHPVSEKTDRELRRAICVGSMCPRCENRGVCEYGKEAIARGFFGGPVAKAKRPEDEAKRHEWFLRGVPESEERQEGWQSVAELAQEYGLSYQHMYSLLRKSGARPVAKIRTNFSRSSVTTAYYSAAEAVQLIVMHCAQTGNQKMLDWFAACGA